jgi:hypothetical protein
MLTVAAGLPPARTSAIRGEMIMYDGFTTGSSHPQDGATVRRAVAALRRAWTAYTLKRAIRDVASMREEDYRQFGLNKVEILAALARLRDEIATEGTSGHDSDAADSPPLAIVVSRRESTLRARP